MRLAVEAKPASGWYLAHWPVFACSDVEQFYCAPSLKLINVSVMACAGLPLTM